MILLKKQLLGGIKMADVKISDSIVYIGVDDKDIDLFESQYEVPNGVSYNSYLILDEKIAVMDTADMRVSDKWFENLEKALNGAVPDYLIVSHLEPDHAGNIKKAADKYPEMKIVVNSKSETMLPQFFEISADRLLIVKEGDELSLGSHTLQFFMAPMVHWPEVMVEYEKSEKILFSAAQVQALLKNASALDIQTICPLHGPILKENLEYYIGKYMTWSSYEPEDKGILIAYASIHGNTAKAAKKLKEILESKGAEKVAITDLARDDMAEAIEDAFRYDRMILAAASYDAGVFPCMEDFLHHLKSKAYQKRTVGLLENGSWAPSAARTMKAVVEQMKNVSIVEPVVTIKSTMKDSDIENMEKLADAIINA